ncbi:hypothetical protein Tco_1037877 [Tanacetum coccineum]
MWSMFYREKVNYPKLIWEDFAFQIDHRKERKSRRETMPFPRFTKVIINHFFSQHKSFSNVKCQHYHTIKDDGIVSILKFVRIREDYQEYGLPIPDMILDDREVSEESDSEPARKRTASRRVVKKKVIISEADNIIPDPDFALGLGKYISSTEVAKEETARQVHATHVRIMTESEPEPAKKKTSSRSTRGVVIQDPPSVPKPKLAILKLKIKGVQPITPEEQEAADIMQALKESKKTSKRQPGTKGSSEGTGVSPGVPDDSTVVPTTSSEGTGTKPGVPDEEKVTYEEKVILEWGSEQESEYSEEDQGNDEEVDWIDSDEDEEKKDDTDEDKSINLEMTDDEFVHGVEQVNNDEDEEMTNAEVEESRNCDEENIDAAKTGAGKIKEVKDYAKKVELPPTSSSLSISSGFGDQFLKLSFDTSLVSTVKDTTDAEINSLLDIMSQSKVPYIQSSSILTAPISVISKPVVLTPILVTPSVDPATTLLTPSSVSTIPPLRVSKIKKDVSELKKIDHFAKALAALKSQVPMVVEQYLGSKIESKKSALEILKIKKEQAEKQKMPRNPANHRLYHALIEALIEDKNTMDKGVADIVKDNKRKHDDDDDEDPLAGPNQGKKTKRQRTKESESSKKPSTIKETPKGKAPSKGSKIGKSTSTKEPVKEPIANVVMDDAINTTGEDVVRDDDRPQDSLEPKTDKTPNPKWFKQPPRPPTPDPEWNKHQVVLGQPEQPWFNQMVFATKDPLTFNDLIATPIDFSKYVLNRLKIDNLTQDILLGPAYNMLKDTCTSSIQLEYNSQECFNALTDKLDWNNPEGDRYPFDLSKPLPLSQLNKFSKKNVYSTQKILGVKSVSVKKLHGYGHLEEVVVKRADRHLYKFKEGNFVNLHLNDIEYMLILAVQHKLFHLNKSDIVDFIMDLHMFIRSLIIKRRCYTPPRQKREV